MIIVACTLLALLVIVSGMKLLAQTHKDNLGNVYKYVSWIVMIIGFLCLMCCGMHCAMKCCHHGDRCKMENRCDMDDDDGGCYMMHHHHGMGGGCMMHRGCCDGMGGGCCNDMGGNCKEGSECHDGDSKCNMNMGDGGSCPMMKDGHCAKGDSACTNMKK
jgi:hypothetical protein